MGPDNISQYYTRVDDASSSQLKLTILLNGHLALWAGLDVGVVLDVSLVGLDPASPLQVLGVHLVRRPLLGLGGGTSTRPLMVLGLAVATEHKLKVEKCIIILI